MSKTENKNISKAKKIYNIISTIVVGIIFVFLIVVVGLMLWQRKSGGESSIFGYYMYEVLTDSMSGTIEPGEVILSKKIDDVNTLKEGDIITFVAPSGPLRGYNETHRIIEIVYGDDGTIKHFRTQGDHEEQADSWELKPSEVKAKYVRKSPFITGFRSFLSHWYGYVLLIALPLTVVGALLIGGYVKDRVASETAKQKDESKPSLDSMSDEEKKKLLEGYLENMANSTEEQKQDDK